MNNKNNKNTLLQSVAYGPHAAYMALRLKASFHASPAAIMALLAKHRLHQSKNIALRAEKPIFATKTITKTNTFLWFKSSMVQEFNGSRVQWFKSSMVNYVDFCHDSANQASLMAFAAPKVQEMFFSEAMFLLLDVCNNDSYVIRAVAWA